ncbi:glutathione S-transferase, putative [Ixodes scapularis]|uniref:Glutathione S-transferase, putative n=1 Tax=Ixodes scapularis TaxID=6945 RepID=B7PYB4_IXOSC|nr:glutathione S-transferase, putative [Ixodes scapularis]|eukprot:XP_002402865.1 glutathione S-transferase, putative [Ixodes scapularis]
MAGCDFEYVTLEKSKAAEAEAGNAPSVDKRPDGLCGRLPRGNEPAPFGSLPVLYLDGEMLGSDYAICVFIAREHAKDLREKVPRYLRYFEKLLKQNNTDYFVGDQLTWADLAVTFSCQQLLQRFQGALDRHSQLKAHYERVTALPRVKAFLAEHAAAADR